MSIHRQMRRKGGTWWDMVGLGGGARVPRGTARDGTRLVARFIQAQEAFRWLSDPQQREVYVAQLEGEI